MEKKIKKQIILGTVISVVAFAASVLSFSNLGNIYFGSTRSKNWMSEIDGNKYLSEISIPGSHDSDALYSLGDFAGKCQDVSIDNQLTYGVRFLDIRLQYNTSTNDFSVIHGSVHERDSFNNVFASARSFLKAHPTETIIMSVKNEYMKKDIEAFATNFEKLVMKNSSLWFYENRVPKLDEVRGKIVLLSRYYQNTIGIDMAFGWKSPDYAYEKNTFDMVRNGFTYHIQDHYKLENAQAKWDEAVECFNYAKLWQSDYTTYTINFMSGTIDGGFPPSYSAPVAKVINKKFLKEYSNYTFMGTVLFDFISEDIAKAVYERNFL